MAVKVAPFNSRQVPLDIKTGEWTVEGLRQFQDMWNRMGGAIAPSNNELKGYADAAQAAAEAAQTTANTAQATAVAASVAATNAQDDANTAQATADGAVLDAATAQAAADAAQIDATQALADAATVAADLASHEAAADPHPQYLRQVEADALYEVLTGKDAANGYAGLNASSRTTKGVDTTDDVITDSTARGPVMKSPNGHYWRAAISNLGVVTWTDLGTTKP